MFSNRLFSIIIGFTVGLANLSRNKIKTLEIFNNLFIILFNFVFQTVIYMIIKMELHYNQYVLLIVFSTVVGFVLNMFISRYDI